MLTQQRAYENWQRTLRATIRVEVSVAQVYQCLESGMPYPQELYGKLKANITLLQELLKEIVSEIETLQK